MSKTDMETPLIELPKFLPPVEQIEWLARWLAEHTDGQKPPEGALACAARLILERNAEIERLGKLIDDYEKIAAECYSDAQQGRVLVPNPIMRCPSCGAPEIDFDGMGCVACPRDPKRCFCPHPSTTDGVCGICGDSGPDAENPRVPSDPPWGT